MISLGKPQPKFLLLIRIFTFCDCVTKSCLRVALPPQFSSVQFSPLTDWVIRGNMRAYLAEILLPVFSAGGCRVQFWHGWGCPLFDVVQPAFVLPTTASTTRMVLEKLPLRVTCPNHARFRLSATTAELEHLPKTAECLFLSLIHI